MIIKAIPTGEIQANCYIVMDENTSEAVIIDPGADEEIIYNLIENLKNNIFELLTKKYRIFLLNNTVFLLV